MNQAAGLVAWAESSTGRVRKRNEDAWLMMPDKSVYLVADGMGGHRRGDLASQICVDAVREFYAGADSRKTLVFFRKLFEMPFDGRAAWERNLCAAIEYANRRIVQASSENPELSGMGTTVVAAAFSGTRMFVAWCGDSRIYRFRDNRLSMVSDDHSLVNQYVKAGMLTREQAREFPHRNVILHALGLDENLKYEWVQRRTRPGDVYLLCSDGLNDMITDETIEAILQRHLGGCGEDGGKVSARTDTGMLKAAGEELVDAAMMEGGVDNITAMLVCVRDTSVTSASD